MTERADIIRTFLETLWGSMEGNVVVGTLDKPGPRGILNRFADFKYPEEFDQVLAWVEDRSSGDVYASPLIYGEERNPDNGRVRRIPENAIHSLSIYQDSDTCTVDKFRLRPSVHLESSAGRYQDFWILDEPIPAADAANISHKIAIAHREDGSDPSSWSANKLLRIPGTYNSKHGFPSEVLAEYNGAIYNAMDIEGAYDDVELTSRPIIRLPADVSYDSDMDLPDYQTAMNKLPPNFNMNYLLDNPQHEHADRSRARYLLLCELFRTGDLEFEDVLSLAWHAPVSRKWKEDSRNIRGLIQEALKAQAEISYERSGTEPSRWAEDGFAFQKPTERDGWPKLLTDEERDSIAGYPTFIDKFCQFVQSRQNKMYNAPYARMMAWQVLSGAFVDTVFIPRGNGPEYCNLFSMALGDSGTGKTTTMKYWDNVMNYLYAEDPGWGLGSNASPNALHEKLLERDGKFSCFYADEAHGWFKQVSGQQWADGIYESIAAYYDGVVPPMLRTGNKEISGKRGKTMFNIVFFGTMKGDLSLTNVLDRSMFLSGLLARFIWTIGDEIEATEETMAEEDAHADYIRLDTEPVIEQWVREFDDTKKKYRAKHKRRMIAMNMDRDALDRMSRAKWDIVSKHRTHPQWDLLEPALRGRMGPNIRKAATLLAAEEGADTVQLTHVLLALQAAEEWLNAVLIMAEKISDSEWKRLTDEVYDFIASKTRVSTEAVHRRFSSRRGRDLNEQIDAIRAQGRVVQRMESGKSWLMANG